MPELQPFRFPWTSTHMVGWQLQSGLHRPRSLPDCRNARFGNHTVHFLVVTRAETVGFAIPNTECHFVPLNCRRIGEEDAGNIFSSFVLTVRKQCLTPIFGIVVMVANNTQIHGKCPAAEQTASFICTMVCMIVAFAIYPGPAQSQTCSYGCRVWFDGCNTCTCFRNGQLGDCTKMMCDRLEAPKCVDPPQSGSDSSLRAPNPPSAIRPEWQNRAHTRRFDNPMFGTYRLDWCETWASNCGKPAADAYCRSLGYNQAIQFEIALDIGATIPTAPIGDTSGRICSDASCDGFGAIWCQYVPG